MTASAAGSSLRWLQAHQFAAADVFLLAKHVVHRPGDFRFRHPKRFDLHSSLRTFVVFPLRFCRRASHQETAAGNRQHVDLDAGLSDLLLVLLELDRLVVRRFRFLCDRDWRHCEQATQHERQSSTGELWSRLGTRQVHDVLTLEQALRSSRTCRTSRWFPRGSAEPIRELDSRDSRRVASPAGRFRRCL